MQGWVLAVLLGSATACVGGAAAQRGGARPHTRAEIINLGMDWCHGKALRCQLREAVIIPGGPWRVTFSIEGRQQELVTLELDPLSGAVVRVVGQPPPHADPAPPPVTGQPAPPPPVGDNIIRVKEVKAGRVFARIIYAKEVKARNGRVGTVIRQGGEHGGHGQGELRSADVRADIIHAKEVHADWIEAQEIHAKEVHIGEDDGDHDGDDHRHGRGHGRGHHKGKDDD